MIKIITIDREYGSGAADIAATLAARLGWKLWDELLTVEIARITGCDCPAVEEREERRDQEFDRPGNSVNGHVTSLLSFQLNVSLKTQNVAANRSSILKRQSSGVSVVIGNDHLIGWQL